MYSQEERPQENYSQKDLLFHDEPILLTADYAGFWFRWVAVIIDTVVLYFANFIINSIFGLSQAFKTYDSFGNFNMVSLVVVISIGFVLRIFYFSLLESSEMQATLGKRALGLKVTDMQGQRISLLNAIGRNLAKILSALILLIGYFMAGFTNKKQALHDILAGTLVIKS